jgi:CheY-like chemotaxis protein
MKTILLADDNPGAVLLWKRELEDEGYRVLLAEDGGEACSVVQEEAPDGKASDSLRLGLP